MKTGMEFISKMDARIPIPFGIFEKSPMRFPGAINNHFIREISLGDLSITNSIYRLPRIFRKAIYIMYSTLNHVMLYLSRNIARGRYIAAAILRNVLRTVVDCISRSIFLSRKNDVTWNILMYLSYFL